MLWLVFFIIESFLKRAAVRRRDPARQMCLSLFFVMRRDLRCADNALIWKESHDQVTLHLKINSNQLDFF